MFVKLLEHIKENIIIIGLIIAITVGAFLFGVIVNEFLPREWFTSALQNLHNGGHEHEILPYWFQLVSGILLTITMIHGLFRKYILPRINKSKALIKPLTITEMNTMVKVEGMTCNHCKMNVENGIKAVEGVTGVTADLSKGTVVIEGEHVDMKKVEEAVSGLGYKFLG